MAIDRLNKVARFIPKMMIVTTLEVAKLFVKEIFVNYGLLRHIGCDRDRKFISENILFKLCGTKISMNFAHYPKMDGHTERTHMSLEDMLKMYIEKRQ